MPDPIEIDEDMDEPTEYTSEQPVQIEQDEPLCAIEPPHEPHGDCPGTGWVV